MKVMGFVDVARRSPVKVLVAVLYACFCYGYLAGLQSDVLSLLIWRVGNVYVHSYFWIPLLLTLLTTALGYYASTLGRLETKHWWGGFLLSSLLPVLLCGMVPEPSWRMLVYVAIAVGGYVVLCILSKVSNGESVLSPLDRHLHDGRSNLLGLLACFFMVVLFGNTDDMLHYELKVQRYLVEKRPDKAIAVGRKSLDTTHLLFALRVYALNSRGELGEKLFDYPIPANHADLLPTADESRRLLIPLAHFDSIRGIMRNPSKYKSEYKDLYLCKLLIDKNIRGFVESLPLYCVSAKSYPRCYREALVLSHHLSSVPYMDWSSTGDEQNYRDFREVYASLPAGPVRANRLRSLYGTTYWWYWNFSK